MSDTPRTVLPDCMMPASAEPCEAYRKLERENTELDATLQRWFKAASPYATPGSLEAALRRFHHWQEQMNDVLVPQGENAVDSPGRGCA